MRNGKRAVFASLSIPVMFCSSGTGDPAAQKAELEHVLAPVIDGDWWQVAGDPDLGPYTAREQQPVDFGVWQAADGTWQLWSCIRHTKCGGNTRLFHRWEGKRLTDKDWAPMGIAMEADTSLGEEQGGLQAPHVIKVDKTYHMFYGDWKRICLAKSDDGKTFTRVLNERGQPDLFAGPWPYPGGVGTRDPMVLHIEDRFFCYYTSHMAIEKDVMIGADFCRVSEDLRHWSAPYLVSFGGKAGRGPWAHECPHVVYRADAGLYYLFRTQRYGEDNVSTVYVSPDPLNFGIDDDRFRLGTLTVAAPEIIVDHNGQDYIAALLPSLKGIRIAKLKWVPLETAFAEKQ